MDVLTTILNAYGLEATEVTNVSDMLIQTQNLGKTTVAELSSAMGKVIPTANANSVALDQLCTGYAIMTANGVATAESTTYMNSMLNELGKTGSTTDTILREKTGKSFGELMSSGSSPVSYTHLDVYKRQAYGNADDFKAVIKQLNLCEDSILDVYMEHVQEGVTRDKIQSLMSNETWFDSKKMQQYFNVEIEEKAAVAACASDYFEKYNNIPETLKGTETENIVDAVLAELEKRSNAAAQAEEQRIEAEKREILDDLYLYGM